METSTIHQADGGREEEWAESQQDSGVVRSRISTTQTSMIHQADRIYAVSEGPMTPWDGMIIVMEKINEIGCFFYRWRAHPDD